MAAEFQEPYSISFQTDSLHSGSISFGRFESEDLSWERRSSFSHNKYLEEVEKYSKPGSVTEKKKLLEAHFKKKGMHLPGSFGGQNGGECRNDNGIFENVRHKDEEEEMNGSTNSDQFDEGVLDNSDYIQFDYGYEGGQFNHVNYSNQYTHFDESPESSEYRGESEVMECERDDPGVISSESQMESEVIKANLGKANVLVEHFLENIEPQKLHETENGSQNISSPVIGTKDGPDDTVANVDQSSLPIYSSPKIGTAGIDKTTLGAVTESKSMNARLKSQDHTTSHTDASKTDLKKHNGREIESPRRVKSERQSPQAAIPTRRLLPRTPKGEDSKCSSSRSSLVNRSASEKYPKPKKAVESQPSGSKKIEPRLRHSPNRLKQTVPSAKPDMRTGTAAFSFKSDERAERRKEYYMKLDEKMHAKEAEMNQIQAKTQEKTQAEIKQFRRSLNFKATPMPSFYHSAASPGSIGNKVTSSTTKAAKVQQKSTSPVNGTPRSSSVSKVGSNRAVFATAPVKTVHATESFSEAGETLPRNNISCPEVEMKNGVTGKESEKVKDSNLQKHRAAENSKSLKDQKAEGKPKMGYRRNSSETVRKSIKGVGIGSNSGMGRLAVGVAS